MSHYQSPILSSEAIKMSQKYSWVMFIETISIAYLKYRNKLA